MSPSGFGFGAENGVSTSSSGVCRIPERLSTPSWASLAGSGAFWGFRVAGPGARKQERAVSEGFHASALAS